MAFFFLVFVEADLYLLPPLLPEREAALLPVREPDTDLPTEPDLLPERDGKSRLCLAACKIAAFILRSNESKLSHAGRKHGIASQPRERNAKS
jgi:hypothetical protein